MLRKRFRSTDDAFLASSKRFCLMSAVRVRLGGSWALAEVVMKMRLQARIFFVFFIIE